MSSYETAEYGNHGGSHKLLSSSLPTTATVLDELLFLVDRPAGHIGSEVAWSPYWGCGSVNGYWALWRGEEDSSAPRRNMVKARVVLVPIAQCAVIKNFDELLAAVGYATPKENTSDVSPLAGMVVDCLASGKGPAIVPNLPIAPLLIRSIWLKLWANARASFSLRTLFGVESLDSSYTSRIVVIPDELRPRWRAHNLLEAKDEPNSAMTRWFSGNASSQLENLLAVNFAKLPGELSVLDRLERIAVCLERLHSGTGTVADALLVVRTVESFTEGIVLPIKDIQVVASKLGELQYATVGEVRTASLAKLEAFEDRSVFEDALSKWVEDRLPAQSIDDALWILEHHAGARHSDWWCTAVGKGIATGCKSKSHAWAQALWKWWAASPASLQQMQEYLPVDAETEVWLSDSAPSAVDDALLTAVGKVCHERKWASLLASALGATRPLQHCIEVLRHNVPNPDAGLDNLLSKRNGGEVVDVAANISWEPLYARAVLHTVKSPELLARISDFNNLVPLLLRHLSAGGDFPAELQTYTYFAKVFDAILSGDDTCIKIANYFGRDAGHFLLGYPGADRLWDILLPVVSTEFIAGSVDEWWARFLLDENAGRPPHQLVENVLNSALSRVRRYSIIFVIRLLSLFPEISEDQFKDWMTNEGFSWDSANHEMLAKLLVDRNWKSSVKEFRWSWKSELKIVAWHARQLLSWPDRFWGPPDGVNKTEPDKDIIKGTESISSNKKIKILFLAANPMNSDRLALDEEYRSVNNKIRAARYRDSVLLSARWAVRPDDLQQAILEEDPTVVHFSGHGEGTIGLVMHSASQDDENLVSSDAMADLLRVLKGGICVVVLNACYSEVQAAQIVKQIDFVVGMSDTIGDEAAREFAAAFYRGLSFGKAIQTAFDLGINQLKLIGLSDDLMIPQLLVRTGVDASTTFLVKGV